jgi:hypothetical protein
MRAEVARQAFETRKPPNTYEAPSCQRVNASCPSRPEAANPDSVVSASRSIFASLYGAGRVDSAPNTYRGSRSSARWQREREGFAFATWKLIRALVPASS